MRITREQLRAIIREALEMGGDPDVQFRVGDVVDVRGADAGLWQIKGFRGSRAIVSKIGGMLDAPVEKEFDVGLLIKNSTKG